jgi:hypothetical protein
MQQDLGRGLLVQQMHEEQSDYPFYKARPLCRILLHNRKFPLFEHLRIRPRCYPERCQHHYPHEPHPTLPVSLTAPASQLGQLQAITRLKHPQDPYNHVYHNNHLHRDYRPRNLEMLIAQLGIMRKRKSHQCLRYRKHMNHQKIPLQILRSLKEKQVCILMRVVLIVRRRRVYQGGARFNNHLKTTEIPNGNLDPQIHLQKRTRIRQRL